MKNLRSVLMVLGLSLSALMAKSQVPVLSSYPSAPATLFLDFDGHLVNGTTWNMTGPINCGASGLTTAQITEVFNRVAEDYRPFRINVTTDSTRFLSAPVLRRMRMIITTSHTWYPALAGGVAMPTSFTWGDDTPAFVFSQALNFNVKNISEAVAHEAGHTLGLYHQALHTTGCVPDGNGNTIITDYNTGSGPTIAQGSEIGWAPIMGVGYYRNMSVWHNGPNPYDCQGSQDDLRIIAGTINPADTAAGFRTDDHTNTGATSTMASFTNNQFTLNGVIETPSDQDMFSFTLPLSGRFQLNGIPYNVGSNNAGSNVDLSIQLLNSSQQLINTYNPGTLLSSIIDSVMNPGVYYLRVDGKGNQYAPEYGSLGSYALQGNFTAGNPLPLRVLRLNGSADKDKHNLSWVIDADEAVTRLVVEISTDANGFRELVQTGNEARGYAYKPTAVSAAQYRLHVSFDNGRQYYSNIVTIKSGAGTRPRVITNPVSGHQLQISSPGSFSWSMSDLSGKQVREGRLVQGLNTVEAASLTGGMYIIRFTDGGQQWNEKIVIR